MDLYMYNRSMAENVEVRERERVWKLYLSRESVPRP